MLTSVADVIDTHTFLARRFRWQWPLDVVGVGEALREAEDLAAGRIEDEPAALLLALWRGRMDLGDAWEQLPLVLVENLVRKIGAEVRLDPRHQEVQVLRMRAIARRVAPRFAGSAAIG
jgi:hypothetical protein